MMNKLSSQPRLVHEMLITFISCSCCSKIPIAITRARKGGAVAKLESNVSRNGKQLKSKEAVTSRTPRTIKKVPNFKKLHKQFEAHIARVSD